MNRITGTAAPKHLLVEQAIREAIRTGRYPPASRLPGEIELAKTLEVSPQTVQTALRRLCGQGILDRRHRVGTFVREANHAPNIGLLIFNETRIETGVSGGMLGDMQNEATARGHSVRPLLLARPYPPLDQLREELQAMRVGAVGMINFLDMDRDFIAAISELLPCVLLNKGISGLTLPYTGLDTFAAARLIVDYFVGRGRKRIAAGVFNMRHQRFAELNVALESECMRQGIRVDKQLWAEGVTYDRDQEQRWLDRVHTAGIRPDAFVLCGSLQREVFPAWLTRTGAQLGRELDAVVFRMAPSALQSPVTEPTLAVDDHAACLAAIRMLMDIVEGKPIASDGIVRIEPQLLLPAGALGGRALDR